MNGVLDAFCKVDISRSDGCTAKYQICCGCLVHEALLALDTGSVLAMGLCQFSTSATLIFDDIS